MLGDNFVAVDPDLIYLLNDLDRLSAESAPSQSTVESIGNALDEQITASQRQGATAHANRQVAPSTGPSLLARMSHWIDRCLTGMPKAPAGLLAILILVGATYSIMSVVDQAFYLDESTRQMADEKIGIELNQSQTIEGFTMSVKRAYADKKQIVIGYTISGPQERNFSAFLASGVFNEAPDPTRDILPALTDSHGSRLSIIGVAAAFDTDAQGGEYGQALRYASPAIAEGTKEIELHFEVGKIVAYEQVREGEPKVVTITGPFEFSFVLPVEQCCLTPQSK